jgi:1,4-alpha-glucan branching enzyme
MKKIGLLFFWILLYGFSFGQIVAVTPTVSPAFFTVNTPITVEYDVTGTSLAGLNNAYAWVWIPGQNIDARYNIDPATLNPSLTDNAKFSKSVVSGRTLFTITFTPSAFFATSIANQTRMGILLKATAWSGGQTTDYLVDFWDGSFKLQLTQPTSRPLFVTTGQSIAIRANTPVSADFELRLNGAVIHTSSGTNTYSYDHFVSEISGFSTIKLTATAASSSDDEQFQYIISGPSPVQARPPGVIAGINYQPDPTKVILCLWAPGKSSAYAYGDFSSWQVLPANQMKRDGEYFWIELTGLTSGVEYGYQYLLNETVKLADPFSDKILDPDDQYIGAETYPGLKPYPAEAVNAQRYYNRVSVFQTGQTSYPWVVSNFQKPAKPKLIIYELLIRDFFENGKRNYQNLIDTIGYFKRLGINAVQLMPIMEFNGNESWGYNPTFMFAPDKYYGTKNKLKEFIDKCHQNGIAVILDIAMNHQDLPNTFILQDFNFANQNVATTNRWFNTAARHPFNVFFDMNHESAYTKKYLDTVNYYWLNEYKVDGFRFDLSKGFTQTNNPSDVGAWSAYDASRIALLKRMADKIWSHSPDAYVILEHFAQNSEEQELADYRSGEGKGMMLWGNLNHSYSQLVKGVTDGSDIAGVYHKNRAWSSPHLIGYMESHDEERVMYRALTEGASASGYSTRNLNTALARMKAAHLALLGVPGPKMIWQFGEMGYDVSINQCVNGTINSNCRLDIKPLPWDYLDEPARLDLFNHVADLNRLHQTYDIFHSGDALMTSGNGLVKTIILRNSPFTANPATPEDMNAVIVANFGLTSANVNVGFPHTGVWFSYYGYGAPINVSVNPLSITLAPGEFRLYTDVVIENEIVVATVDEQDIDVVLHPNPADSWVSFSGIIPETVRVLHPDGRTQLLEQDGNDRWLVGQVGRGLVVLEILAHDRIVYKKVVLR